MSPISHPSPLTSARLSRRRFLTVAAMASAAVPILSACGSPTAG